MPSPNNPSPSAEFLSHAQNSSFHDSNFSSISGHMTQISLTVVNPPAPGNFQPPAQSPSDNQDLRPPFRQEYPVARGHRAPGQSNKPLALNGNNLEVETTDLPFTNSSNDSEYYSAPSSLWEDGPLQYQVIEPPNSMGSGSWSSTNSSLVSLISDSESDFSPFETMLRFPSSIEIYVKAMLSLRQGYPLPSPQPISSLPVEKRRVGTIIGDVGTIREDGSFDYLFNPLLPTTDPKNPLDLPTAFNDILPPVARISQVRSAFNSRTAVCSLGSHCDTNRETMELSISHTSDDGALLFLPDGASQEDLINSGEIKQFVIKHAETWISYAISTGRDIDRNSLYFVTGCTKAGDWGMATFNRSTREESSLKLGQSTHPNDPRYIWERSRGCVMARTGPGPDEELDNEGAVPQNQTLFIKGYKIAFSEDAWTRILAQNHGTIAVNTGQYMSGSTSEINASSGQTSGGSQAPSSGDATYNTSNCNRLNLEPFPAYDKLFHPSDIINRVLLEEIPEAKIAIVHDDDWCDLTDGYDAIDSKLVVQLLRSKYSASYYEGAAVLSTTQNAMSAGDETIDLGITARSMTRVSEITDIDPLFTDSSDESHSDPSSFWGDGLLQHQELPNAMRSGPRRSTNSSFVSLISDSESNFSLLETMLRFPSSNEIYVKAMLPLRQGYPLSAPQPISSLPVEKRRAGVMIGDIGIIRDDGSFECLFNLFLPTTGPKCRNDIPTAFNDTLPPVARTSQVRNALNSRKALCSLESHGETDVCSPLSSAVHDPCLQNTNEKVAYGWLSENYNPGDDIFLFGSSRRAFKGRPLQIRPLQIPFAYGLFRDPESDEPSDLVTQVRSPEPQRNSSLAKRLRRMFSGKDKAEENASTPERFKGSFFLKNFEIDFVSDWDTVSSIGIVSGTPMLPRVLEGQKPSVGDTGCSQDLRNPSSGNKEDAPAEDIPDVHMADNDIVRFAGAHSDIGGNGTENARMNCSRDLRWMGFEAEAKQMTHKPYFGLSRGTSFHIFTNVDYTERPLPLGATDLPACKERFVELCADDSVWQTLSQNASSVPVDNRVPVVQTPKLSIGTPDNHSLPTLSGTISDGLDAVDRPSLKSRNFVKHSHATVFDEVDKGMAISPRPNEEPVVNTTLPWHIRTLASFIMYDEISVAHTPEEFALVHTRLKRKWTYDRGVLVGLAAVNAAIFARTSDSIFMTDTYAYTAVATSSAACSFGIVYNLWFMLRYSRVNLGTFMYRSRDVYGSYVFFSLYSRVPTFCTLISSISLMIFLGLVAYWKTGAVKASEA